MDSASTPKILPSPRVARVARAPNHAPVVHSWGAARRDFHNFNILCRNNPDFVVVGLTISVLPVAAVCAGRARLHVGWWQRCAIEERGEYEPYIAQRATVYAGAYNEAVLKTAEQESGVIRAVRDAIRSLSPDATVVEVVSPSDITRVPVQREETRGEGSN